MNHLHQPGYFGDADPQQGGIPAVELAAKITSAEAQINPDPSDYRAAGELLVGYFDHRNAAGFAAGEVDKSFTDVVEHITNAVSGLYTRDDMTHKATTNTTIGLHPADINIRKALGYAWKAQSTAESSDTNSRPGGGRIRTSGVLQEWDGINGWVDPSSVMDGSGRSMTLQRKASETIYNAVIDSSEDPVAYPVLAELGKEMSGALVALADVTARHDTDIGRVGSVDPVTREYTETQGEIPQFRDYIAGHVGRALEGTVPAR